MRYADFPELKSPATLPGPIDNYLLSARESEVLNHAEEQRHKMLR